VRGSLIQTLSFGSTEADILPSRPAGRQSAARKRGPGGRAAAPARSAGAQRPGRREHGAMLVWSGGTGHGKPRQGAPTRHLALVRGLKAPLIFIVRRTCRQIVAGPRGVRRTSRRVAAGGVSAWSG